MTLPNLRLFEQVGEFGDYGFERLGGRRFIDQLCRNHVLLALHTGRLVVADHPRVAAGHVVDHFLLHVDAQLVGNLFLNEFVERPVEAELVHDRANAVRRWSAS